MSALDSELLAIRTGIALSDSSHVTPLLIEGEDAFATLDAVCSSALTLQDAQLRQTLLLRDDATVFADAVVGRDDERYYLLTEGPSAGDVEAWLRRHAKGPKLSVTRLDQSHRLVSLHGPWAWEFLAGALGPDVVGMPYLSLLRGDRAVCFRAGKTGEYGYDLLLPADEAAALQAELTTLGREWGVVPVSLAAVEHCGLENWFFSIRREGAAGLTPLELGLQWRVSYRKDFVGSAALKERRAKGVRARLTCVLSEAALTPGAPVQLDGESVGTLIAAARSELRGAWVGSALLDVSVAWPGIDGLRVGAATARTVSPPVLENRSLHVSPQRHTFQDRAALEFPPFAR